MVEEAVEVGPADGPGDGAVEVLRLAGGQTSAWNAWYSRTVMCPTDCP